MNLYFLLTARRKDLYAILPKCAGGWQSQPFIHLFCHNPSITSNPAILCFAFYVNLSLRTSKPLAKVIFILFYTETSK